MAGAAWTCCAASHAEDEWLATEALRAGLPPFVSSFGIHPQSPGMRNAGLLARLCAEGRLAAVGEAGFDFFGDAPDRVRGPETEEAQRVAFEYQLELAEKHGLTLLLHLRKAMDLAFEYAPRLRRIRSAVFHSYSGTAGEAEALLSKRIEAYFSFGAAVLNGHKRAIAACAAVPEGRLLAETDAPWQPPRGSPFCRLEHLEDVIEGIARIRGAAAAGVAETTAANFSAAYGAGRRGWSPPSRGGH
jgi:TatD DNase family protein